MKLTLTKTDLETLRNTEQPDLRPAQISHVDKDIRSTEGKSLSALERIREGRLRKVRTVTNVIYNISRLISV